MRHAGAFGERVAVTPSESTNVAESATRVALARSARAAQARLARWSGTAAVIVLALVALAIYLAAPRHSDDWWSDTPRHAMDGVFYLDLLRAMPLHHLKAWALDYYTQYPALTVGFYPPLGHLAFSLGYAVFGVHHWVPVMVEAVFFFALLCAVLVLAQQAVRTTASHAAPPGASSPWITPCAGLTGAILVAASPQMLYWGQQAMLDVPALAWAAWAVVFLARYAETRQPRDLAGFAALSLLALYTKQTIAIPLTGAVLGLLAQHRLSLLLRRHVWVTALLGAVALVPLALITLRFAAFDLVNVGSRPDLEGVPPPMSLASAAWYAEHAPAMFGWPLLILAGAGLVLGAVSRPARTILLGWLILAYVALSLIALKEERHGLTLVVPLGVLASGAVAWLLARVAQGVAAAAAGGAVVLASVSLFAASLAQNSAPPLSGYRQAVETVMSLMPQGGRVLFSGNRDGAFTVDVRFRDPGRRFTVLRVDKLFLHVAVQPGLGLHPRDLTRDEVEAMLDRYGIEYVVSEPKLWLEAPVMREFDALLHSPRFEEVARSPVQGPVGEKELVIYRNKDPLPSDPAPITPEIMGGVVRTGT
jgi:hypothetical protein